MMALVQFNIVTLAAAMAIGLVTGWWIFRRRPAASENLEDQGPA
jgi:hypothetical protein